MIKETPSEKIIAVRIEKMELEDVATVAELDKRCFASPWSLSAYTNEIHNPSAYYVVARTNYQIIGYAGMWLIMDEAHITTIGVAPEFRGKKIGEKLLIHILDESIHRGARRATLEVRKSNQVAQNLYNKYNFRAVAIRKSYYTNNNEDAVIMWVDDLWEPDFLKKFRTNRETIDPHAEDPKDNE